MCRLQHQLDALIIIYVTQCEKLPNGVSQKDSRVCALSGLHLVNTDQHRSVILEIDSVTGAIQNVHLEFYIFIYI